MKVSFSLANGNVWKSMNTCSFFLLFLCINFWGLATDFSSTSQGTVNLQFDINFIKLIRFIPLLKLNKLYTLGRINKSRINDWIVLPFLQEVERLRQQHSFRCCWLNLLRAKACLIRIEGLQFFLVRKHGFWVQRMFHRHWSRASSSLVLELSIAWLDVTEIVKSSMNNLKYDTLSSYENRLFT